MTKVEELQKELADKDQFIENILIELQSVYELLGELKQSLNMIAAETTQLVKELGHVD